MGNFKLPLWHVNSLTLILGVNMAGSKNLALLFASLSVALFLCGGLQAAEVTPYGGDLSPVSSAGYTVKVHGDGNELELSISELEKLPLYKSVIETNWDSSGEFIGVKLVDLLKHAGITQFKRLYVRASNDYKVTIESTDEGIDNAILASHLNGEPFSLDDKGPFFIVWPDQAEDVMSGKVTATKWAWSTVEIQKIR